MVGRRLRVKAAFFDKPSGRGFDNLTPVSTWVDEAKTVAQLLPVLAKRFWSGVETEVLDDDAHLPQPALLKAVTVTFNGSLVLKDDNLYEVLSAEAPDQDNLIVVGLKGAAEYLPKVSTPVADPGAEKSPSGSAGWVKQGPLMVAVRPQPAHQQHGSGPQLSSIMAPVDLSNGHYAAVTSAMMGSGGKPNMLALAAVPNGNGHHAGAGAVAEPQWPSVTYPHIHSMQIMQAQQQQQQDGTASVGIAPAVGSKRPVERENNCLPFLRDISTVLELYDRWEMGMDGDPPLKRLTGAEYRTVRTRYHEIKNFILRLKARSAAETAGDDRKMAGIMQDELDAARTQHGARMGLPSWVRMVATDYVKSKGRKSDSQSPSA